MIIMCGFTALFYIVFLGPVTGFRTLGNTFFSLWRGMLGDMPLDEMMYVKPNETPILYCTFCFVTVFTVFTVLIAVMTDSYEEVIDDKESEVLDETDEGGIAVILRFVLGFTGHYVAPEQTTDVEPDGNGLGDTKVESAIPQNGEGIEMSSQLHETTLTMKDEGSND